MHDASRRRPAVRARWHMHPRHARPAWRTGPSPSHACGQPGTSSTRRRAAAGPGASLPSLRASRADAIASRITVPATPIRMVVHIAWVRRMKWWPGQPPDVARITRRAGARSARRADQELFSTAPGDPERLAATAAPGRPGLRIAILRLHHAAPRAAARPTGPVAEQVPGCQVVAGDLLPDPGDGGSFLFQTNRFGLCLKPFNLGLEFSISRHDVLFAVCKGASAATSQLSRRREMDWRRCPARHRNDKRAVRDRSPGRRFRSGSNAGAW